MAWTGDWMDGRNGAPEPCVPHLTLPAHTDHTAASLPANRMHRCLPKASESSKVLVVENPWCVAAGGHGEGGHRGSVLVWGAWTCVPGAWCLGLCRSRPPAIPYKCQHVCMQILPYRARRTGCLGAAWRLTLQQTLCNERRCVERR
jgi:hypothetical protein